MRSLVRRGLAALALLAMVAWGPAQAQRAEAAPVAPAGPAAAGERLVCPPALPPASETGAPRDRGLLWKATRDGRTVYLYGTLHVGRPAWRRLGPVTSAALRASDTLALELDPGDPAVAQAMADLRHPDSLPPALQQRLQRAFERACLATEALAVLHPVLQATTLTVMEARWLGMDSAYAMEHLLLAQVRAAGTATTRPRVVSLEDVQVQIKALVPDEPSQMHTLLEQTLQQLEDRSARRVMQTLVGAWERGDVALLEDHARWCECAATEEDRAFLQRLNDARNAGLADGIEAQHRQGRRVFAAVGVLHLTGPQGLPRLLAERGFRVERVPFAR